MPCNREGARAMSILFHPSADSWTSFSVSSCCVGTKAAELGATVALEAVLYGAPVMLLTEILSFISELDSLSRSSAFGM